MFREIADWPGFVRGEASDVAMAGTKAYVLLSHGGLRVLDVADPSNPRVLGDTVIPWDGRVIRVAGNLAYIAFPSEGLQIYDISDPTHASLLGAYKTAAIDLELVGNLAYVVSPYDGLLMVDVSNPTKPSLAGSYGVTAGTALCVEIVGTRAYLGLNGTPEGGFQVLDISNPAVPVAISDVYPGSVRDIAVAGGRVYVIGRGGFTTFEGNPSALSLVGTVEIVEGFSVQTVGNLAYVAGTWPSLTVLDVSGSPRVAGTYSSRAARKVKVSGDLVFLATISGLEILDASHPEAWGQSTNYATTDYPSDIAVSNGRAYIAGGIGLEIFDATQPGQWFSLARYTNIGGIQRVEVRQNVAYMSLGPGGLHVVDFTETGSPRAVVQNPFMASSYRVAFAGSLAYVANGSGIFILDISEPASPRLVCDYYAGGSTIMDVSADGILACLGVKEGGVLILDVSNPAKPKTAGKYEGFPTVAVFLDGTTLYVSDPSTGYDIVDVSRPSNPSQLARINPGFANKMFVANKTAYLVSLHGGLYIYDVTDPASPAIKTVYPGDNLNNLAVAGGYAYVTHGVNGIMAADLAKAPGPPKIGENSPLGAVRDVAIVNSTAFVADDQGGLQIFDLRNPAKPSAIRRLDFLGPVLNVALDGHFAYAGTKYDSFIVDVGNPSQPVILSKYEAGIAQPEANLLYVLGASRSFSILDTTDKAKPTTLGRLAFPDAISAQVVGRRAYVGTSFVSSKRIFIVDVTNPKSPVQVGEIAAQGFERFCVVGNLLYGMDSSSLQVWDVSKPQLPVRMSSYDLRPFANTSYPAVLRVKGSRAYIITAESLLLVDVSNPDRPSMIGTYPVKGVEGLALVGNNVFLAGGAQGLIILEEPLHLTIERSLLTGQPFINFAIPDNAPIVLEASSNLRDWTPLQTNASSGAYLVPTGENPLRRFYRGRQFRP